eukprot:CAMPEP_0173429378 /NCGR_PEP_ID=MMETSP1357-20121228/8102_1 /TAXON_ID=77926 /ORGANISM="Hemiselmis rufescens, Strain PCC563" /LENGTH=179 /DNA_ID=CAMNT_0014393551 /DNA_START=246 /DNA_END=786 /DNA_ORIENTATION=-
MLVVRLPSCDSSWSCGVDKGTSAADGRQWSASHGRNARSTQGLWLEVSIEGGGPEDRDDAHIPPGCPDYMHTHLKGKLILDNRYRHVAGPDQAKQGYILAGHDLSGWDGLSYPALKNDKKALGAKCFRACVGTKHCQGYTYHPVDGKCYLKSRIQGIGGNICGNHNDCWFWGRPPSLYR